MIDWAETIQGNYYEGFSSTQKLKLYDYNEQFIGIGESNLMSEILPKRLFV